MQAGRFTEAVRAYQDLLALHPGLADCWYNLGYLQARIRQFDAAIAAYQRAIDLGVASPEEAHLNRSAIQADHLARPDEAIAELRRALALNPHFVPAWVNVGNLLERQGDAIGAADAYESALRIQPSHALALSRLPNVRPPSNVGDELIQRIRRALECSDATPSEQADLGFALGKALDMVGAYDEAFAAYAAANQALRRSSSAYRYEPAVLERYIERLIQAFPAPAPAADFHGRDRVPLFICGMFRSGSTLVETILGCHRSVTAGGEIDLIPVLARAEALPVSRPFAVFDEEALARWRRGYLEGMAVRFPGANTGILTDKRPDNFLYIGLIKAMFPGARIVHTRRDPLDNCLSLYFSHLGPAMGYATDLVDTAHWYRQYERLMAHWRTLYPNDIHDVAYDRLVTEPEPVIQSLLRFCGLSWDDACLSFHQTAARIGTPSNWQVRKPLYSQASGRWRSYARHLGPLLAAMGHQA
jgi:hypothetical protein